MAQDSAQKEEMIESEPKKLTFAQREAIEKLHKGFDDMTANVKLHQESEELYHKFATGNGINHGPNGEERKTRLDRNLGRELEKDALELSHPTNAGLGIAEGQEPTNILNNPLIKPSKA